uniref:Uncharacterized protein n=1 Tax=Leersia perrieri TaxID=77586 RepID=A0A0D9Y0B2_9ORYZ
METTLSHPRGGGARLASGGATDRLTRLNWEGTTAQQQMSVLTRAKKRRLEEESSRPDLAPKGGEDLISCLPDDILVP